MLSGIFIKYLLIISCFFVFSILINSLFLRFSKNMGIRHLNKKLVRWSSTAKPSLGGISFYIIFLLSINTFFIVFDSEHLNFNLQLAGIMAAISLAFLIGLADDAYDTKVLLKFLAQLGCGIILIATGTSIHLFENEWLNYAISIFWVVGIMNSINMLDNMDAVAGVAAFFAILSLLLAALFNTEVGGIYYFVLWAMAVSILGFLFFNWHPSKMYMGDTGSQFLGAALAAFSIIILWNHPSTSEASPLAQLMLPLLAFLVPICDTTTVFINRIAQGKSPFVGGKDHTTHHLSYRGLKERQIACCIAGIGFVSLICIGIRLNQTSFSLLLMILLISYTLITFFTLFFITKINNTQTKSLNDIQ